MSEHFRYNPAVRDDDGSYGPWWRAGTKVAFKNRDGHELEREQARGLFKIGQVLTVKSSKTFGSSSTVEFEEVEGSFNTVMFLELLFDLEN